MSNMVEIRPPYEPHVKQMMLHNAPVSTDEIWLILFGGERGGGKSAGILGDAFLFATTYPGAKCIILRENLDAVKQSFLDKLGRLFPQTMNGIKLYEYREKSSNMAAPLSRSIVFPNGSYITLQRVANLAEAEEKQGWEFNYLAIDELTKQTEDTFDYLLTTVRSASMWNPYLGKKYTIPTKVVCGCNPGGIGHKWVKRRFIDTTVIQYHPEKNTPLRTKDFVEYMEVPSRTSADGVDKIKINVRFIPASWRDNPYLNSAYVAMLAKQPEHRRKMDLEGNWDVIAGRKFDFQDDSFIDDFNAMELISKFRPDIYISIDWGYYPSKHSAHFHAVFYDGSVITFDRIYGDKLIFEDFVDAVRRKAQDLYIIGTCLPHDMYRSGDRYRDKQGRVIGETKADVFEAAGLNPIGVESGKGTVLDRYDKIHSASQILASDGKTKKFRIAARCKELKEELEEAMEANDGSGKLDPSSSDHAIDDYGHFLAMYSQDIAPLGIQDFKEVDTRSKWIRRLDAEEKALRTGEVEEFENEQFDNYVASDGDLV